MTNSHISRPVPVFLVILFLIVGGAGAARSLSLADSEALLASRTLQTQDPWQARVEEGIRQSEYEISRTRGVKIQGQEN